ncbi:FAD-dependent oxidoreductase [Aureisphaera galaxeae]|uniref:flavin monoamine oxidase family protein n=1 Tax=Aureisphaera galaxeae TaxID=1538023 RepID=UPI0023505C67|nr:FAD-dependent oxidoreductase [Aureisphaera galaxeae]MDC8004562.1 FAD-dependent oxidoreductase [Aureisphaera galaxeae]
MTRSEFVKVCGLLGISLPFQSVLHACSTDDNGGDPIESSESVLIIGAGAAGMAAGHLLAQQGIDFRILEASSRYGGRTKRNNSFADFPIPLGGEWLHVDTSVLSEIVNDPSVNINTQTVPYDLENDTAGYYDGSSLSVVPLGTVFGNDFIDRKFVGSSWFDFFETYVLPSVQSRITFNTPVTAIDYSGDKVTVTDDQGQTYSADRIIVTVPVKILQSGSIAFTPALPAAKQNAIQNVNVWGGFKAFFKFSNNFYPTYLAFDDSETPAGQRLYYDAAYGQNTNMNVLGLFSVGQQAEPYQALSGDALRDYILNELDAVFNGAASANYVDHIVQNWNEEPYAQGAYITDQENWKMVRTLGESVNNKLYFAGDAYSDGEDWSSVHVAARSARAAVDEMVG